MRPATASHRLSLLIVTGVSGAGKSTALRALEDLDYYCADNLPLPLLPKFIELLATRGDISRAALVIDARGGEFLNDAPAILREIRQAGYGLEILFLDAPDDIVVRRYSETRRRHPLSDTDVRDGLAAERRAIASLRQEADAVIDTGALTVHLLRALVQERYGGHDGQMSVTLLSFGFKHGVPAEADVILDVRFLPNPFFVENLSALSGEDEAVKRFVLENDDTQALLAKAEDYLRLSLRGFRKEGKSYATIAIGCTGGRHRSVAVVNELAARLEAEFPVLRRHRDINRARLS